MRVRTRIAMLLAGSAFLASIIGCTSEEPAPVASDMFPETAPYQNAYDMAKALSEHCGTTYGMLNTDTHVADTSSGTCELMPGPRDHVLVSLTTFASNDQRDDMVNAAPAARSMWIAGDRFIVGWTNLSHRTAQRRVIDVLGHGAHFLT